MCMYIRRCTKREPEGYNKPHKNIILPLRNGEGTEQGSRYGQKRLLSFIFCTSTMFEWCPESMQPYIPHTGKNAQNNTVTNKR